MNYSDTTNKNGILQMIEQTTRIGDANITSNTLLKAYFTTLINQWYRIIAFYAWRADKRWSFDDSTQTTNVEGTTTLIDQQAEYRLPSTALDIKMVEVMHSNGKYQQLSFMFEEDPILSYQQGQENPSFPTHYRLVGNIITLYPKPNIQTVTAVAGLRVTADREVVPFIVSDTTKVAGIPLQFQPILYYGPSLEWAIINSASSVEMLCNKMLGNFPGLLDMTGTYFSERNKDEVLAISPERISFK